MTIIYRLISSVNAIALSLSFSYKHYEHFTNSSFESFVSFTINLNYYYVYTSHTHNHFTPTSVHVGALDPRILAPVTPEHVAGFGPRVKNERSRIRHVLVDQNFAAFSVQTTHFNVLHDIVGPVDVLANPVNCQCFHHCHATANHLDQDCSVKVWLSFIYFIYLFI